MSDTEEKFEIEEEVPGTDTVSMDAELDTYSKDVQTRINKEVAEKHRLRRELEEARAFGNKAADLAKRAVEEVKSLRERTAGTEDAMIENLTSSIRAELDVAKRDLKEAYEAQDGEKIAEATARVSATAADLRRAEVAKVAHKNDLEHARANPPPKEPERAPPPRQIVPKAQEWISLNSDLMADPEKRKVVIAADNFVKALGMDPNSDDYYKEVDKMVSSRLNGGTSDGGQQDRKPSAGATPTGRSAPAAPPGPRKVVLTANERAIAGRMGVTLEAYAREKARLG